jgi:mono/diheme cytochrome c family protein
MPILRRFRSRVFDGHQWAARAGMMRWIMASRVAQAISILLSVTAGCAGARAAEIDLAVGRRLAQTHCAECHGAQRTRLQTQAPTFYELAQDPSTTELSLRFQLTTPHRDMPNLKLPGDDLATISAYILSLREPR